MEFDAHQTFLNIRQAATDDLLDRVTAYRAGMEPDAIDMIEHELARRGIRREAIDCQREEYERTCLYHPDGTAMMCSQCRKPAIGKGLGWLRLLKFVPLLPRNVRWCSAHAKTTSE